MLFKKDEFRLLWVFYLSSLLQGLSVVIMPFMIVYFRELGFSFFQIALLTSAFALGMFFFEVPTGAFADGWSRKYSVILGFFLTAICVALISLFTSFFPIFILWFLAGMGMTFVSGAEESWVVDNLNYYNRKDLHHEFFVKWNSLAAFGFIFSSLIGAILVKNYSISILWVIFGFGFLLVGLILSVFGKEMYKPKKLRLFESIKQTFHNSKKGFKFVVKHRTVFLLILGAVFTALMFFAEDGWQPFLVKLSLPTHALGFVYSLIGVALVISPFLSKLLVKMKVKNAVSIIIFIKMLILLAVFFLVPPLYLIGAGIFILAFGFRGLIDPLLQTYLHKFIPKNIRATVVSVKSMVLAVSFALFALIAGALMDVFGPQKVIAIGGLFGVLAIVTYMKIKD